MVLYVGRMILLVLPRDTKQTLVGLYMIKEIPLPTRVWVRLYDLAPEWDAVILLKRSDVLPQERVKWWVSL